VALCLVPFIVSSISCFVRIKQHLLPTRPSFPPSLPRPDGLQKAYVRQTQDSDALLTRHSTSPSLPPSLPP